MKDRRIYSRLVLSMPILIFKGSDTEITCEILDISENGLGFQISQNDFAIANLKVGDVISFQFIDYFMYGKSTMTVLLSDDLNIVHINKDSDHYTVGGTVNSKEFTEYVLKRSAATVLERKERD